MTPRESFYEELDRKVKEGSGVARLLRERPDNLHDYQGCLKDEVYAMLRPYLEPGTGETTIRAIWPLLVELVERRKSNPVEAEER